jgi:hypothetical protein
VIFNDSTYVDNFCTPHSTQLHVVERFKLVDAGEALDVHVEDPGAFIIARRGRGIAERPRRARKKGKGNDC